jgi:uncharacterized RDD family membrane protein YckC
MKCPKCHYLSFDPEPRCRNCGYTLELGDADLAIKSSDEPLADLALRAAPVPPAPAAMTLAADDAEDVPAVVEPSTTTRRRRSPAASGPFDKELAIEAAREIDAASLVDDTVVRSPAPSPSASAPTPADERAVLTARGPSRPQAPASTELPLFVKAMPAPDLEDASEADDRMAMAEALAERELAPPPVTPKAEPLIRPRADVPHRKTGPLDRDLLEGLARLEDTERRAQRAAPGARVGMVSRLGAAAIDAVLLTGLSAGVLWTTLRWCGLSFSDARVLPIAPTAAFLLVMELGYLLLFTAAGGQTIGKMLCGIRVVDEGAGVLPLRQALYREVVALPSVLALGLGFLPALVGEERALHDRLAHTKVVRA